MSVAKFRKITKYITFDCTGRKLEFDHPEEGEAFMEIVELFQAAYAMNANDDLLDEMKHYKRWVENLETNTEPDAIDVVSFRCWRLSKIHFDVFAEHEHSIVKATGCIDNIRSFGENHKHGQKIFVFDCVDPSER